MADGGGDPRLVGTEIADSVIDLIGNTPLVRLRRISEVEDIPSVLTMKMETTNPGGSSKDRPALTMIEAARRGGRKGLHQALLAERETAKPRVEGEKVRRAA